VFVYLQDSRDGLVDTVYRVSSSVNSFVIHGLTFVLNISSQDLAQQQIFQVHSPCLPVADVLITWLKTIYDEFVFKDQDHTGTSLVKYFNGFSSDEFCLSSLVKFIVVMLR
jgi:hypothetical protein